MRPSFVLPALAAAVSARFVMYADEWHPTRPTNPADRAGIDHVVLAFAMANATALFQPKVPISVMRSEYPNAKMMIAVGGWGDDIGYYQASLSDASIKQFAANIATMLTNTGADGVDIDWEYPGGNGGDYKQVPNSQKAYQIDAYPKLLAATRAAIGKKLLSIAVPGKKGDMIAFTKENGPKIWPSVDYINVMSYDLMNRRDNVTNHHSSVVDSIQTIKNYLAIGAPPQKMNLGFAYYAKYFTTQGDCSAKPLGCPIVPAEDPVTGKDALTSGAWTFETSHMKPVNSTSLQVSYDGTCGPEKGTKCATGCCSQYGNCGTSPEHCSGACQHAFGTGCTDPDVAGSWQSAMAHGVTDRKAGGQYYFDPANKLFWTWDTPELINAKFDAIVRKYELGGVMAWSLGEDSFDWSHIRAMAKELAKGISPAAPKPAPKKPALKPALKPVPSPAPEPVPVRPLAPSPSKSPTSVVWVDGTAQGPASGLASDPIGAPADSTQQVNSANDAEASTPQQSQPLQARPSPVEDIPPFSPEYLNVMKTASRRMSRAERMRIIRADTIDQVQDLGDTNELPDMDALRDDVNESKDINDFKNMDDNSKDADDLKPSEPPTNLPKFQFQNDGEDVPDKSPLPKFEFLGELRPMGEDGNPEPLGEVLGSGWIWALRKRVLSMFW